MRNVDETLHGANNGRLQQPMVTVRFRLPAGPQNHMTVLRERQAAGTLPTFQPGEVWRMIVHHDVGCPSLSDIPSCLCTNPDLRFERFAEGGAGPAAVAIEHEERGVVQ